MAWLTLVSAEIREQLKIDKEKLELVGNVEGRG